MDDVGSQNSGTWGRVNSLLEELEKDPEWAPILTGTEYIDNPDGQTAQRVETNMRIRSKEDVMNLRKAVASSPGSDEKAYLGIMQSAAHLHETKEGRDYLKTMCENWGVVVGEQYGKEHIYDAGSGGESAPVNPGSQPEGGYSTTVTVSPGYLKWREWEMMGVAT